MKLVILFGPPAVGKMTVGMELARRTGLKLFHNHMTIELALNFFDFGQPAFNRLVGEFRRRIFEEVAQSDLPGLIFTFVWALDLEGEKTYIDRLCDIFRDKGGEIYFVELAASQQERLRRNDTPLRLAEKPSKRDVAWSQAHLLDIDQKHKLNSTDDFFYRENYMKIDNTDLTAAEAAQTIADGFDLTSAL